jgi:hypothetical protein
MLAKKIKNRRKNRIEEKGKRADHDHNFKGHDKENHDGAAPHYGFDQGLESICFHGLILPANFRVFPRAAGGVPGNPWDSPKKTAPA